MFACGGGATTELRKVAIKRGVPPAAHLELDHGIRAACRRVATFAGRQGEENRHRISAAKGRKNKQRGSSVPSTSSRHNAGSYETRRQKELSASTDSPLASRFRERPAVPFPSGITSLVVKPLTINWTMRTAPTTSGSAQATRVTRGDDQAGVRGVLKGR